MLYRFLARLNHLHGTRFDPLARTPERRLIAEYQATLATIAE